MLICHPNLNVNFVKGLDTQFGSFFYRFDDTFHLRNASTGSRDATIMLEELPPQVNMQVGEGFGDAGFAGEDEFWYSDWCFSSLQPCSRESWSKDGI